MFLWNFMEKYERVFDKLVDYSTRKVNETVNGFNIIKYHLLMLGFWVLTFGTVFYGGLFLDWITPMPKVLIMPLFVISICVFRFCFGLDYISMSHVKSVSLRVMILKVYFGLCATNVLVMVALRQKEYIQMIIENPLWYFAPLFNLFVLKMDLYG